MVDIKGYEGLYAVTSCGRVWSYRSKKFLKPMKEKSGYLRVDLRLNNKHDYHFIHRLVAEAYIPNPAALPQVNHKDEVKSHNYINNLEWCDAQYNKAYSSGKKVKCVETGQIYNSLHDAGRSVDRYYTSIRRAIERNGVCGGYHWEMIE